MVNILASLNCTDEVHLLIGVSGNSYSRIQSILSSKAKPILITNKNNIDIPRNLQDLSEDKKFAILNREFDIETDLFNLGRPTVGKIVDRVFVSLSNDNYTLKQKIFEKCQVYRIPINTTESPELSTFTVLSTYTDGDFQLGITTSGKGCKLANRIKREIVNKLPNEIGAICGNVGKLRERIQLEDKRELSLEHKNELNEIFQSELGENEEDSIQNSRFNKFINEYNMSENEKKLQRSRWLSQVVEYYPLQKLADISINDLSNQYKESSLSLTSSLSNNNGNSNNGSESNKQSIDSEINNNQDGSTPTIDKDLDIHSLKSFQKGSISLVGAGPGSLSLLTLGALNEINTADLVLADKLVPEQVIDLIPSKTEKFIARKFPGNAEAAQEELLNLGLKAIQEGKKVVRLKQGDPYIFGRGGEEYIFFENHGYKPHVLPGITSALSSTINSNIPATQRDVADQVLICTGTGRRGVLPNIPEFVKTRTTVFLMSLHRISDLTNALLENNYDPELPATIVERSSCPDQRVTRTKLKYLIEAVEEIGSRPPGLLILGYACNVLNKPLDNQKWIVEEGYDDGNDNVSEIIAHINH
ncbi:hypothetical protein WICMUC_003456 [Wickerhamomyces mucosus]|uniref:Tetrapyrrole methylase domain-containing protein n=1 Tax=Wickerhamomyces mucosus TaxID=1378264 RepID=A0A9P8PMP2_9ASCO|nr:hypothetical protein WICMUC_003456 [Wickerhamomyces mucosus]